MTVRKLIYLVFLGETRGEGGGGGVGWVGFGFLPHSLFPSANPKT